LLKQFGIEDQVRDKLRKCASGVKTAEAVASGAADVGITLLPEMLPVKGVRVAAPLPEALQKYTTYVAAVSTGSAVAEAAAALIRAACAQAQEPAWRAAGVEPL
jgi:molybdate transport system substrate-binding protein